MTAPLDLQAVELRLIAGGAVWSDEEVAALLAHCRALRAALEPLADFAMQTRTPDLGEIVSISIPWRDIQQAAATLDARVVAELKAARAARRQYRVVLEAVP